MVKFILIGLLISSLPAFAGTWERIDTNSLKFSGHIVKGDLEKLENILKYGDKFLFLDSKGGDAEEGVLLANKLLPYQMTVIVDGFCASSCANYLFTAGKNKEIRRGWVGYHGNMTAALSQDWDENAKKMKEDYKLTEEQVFEIHHRLLESAKIEQNYLREIGVSQELFDRTQMRDKGMGDGIDYTFLVPKLETSERYGIKNVLGKQDLTYGQELNLNNIFD